MPSPPAKQRRKTYLRAWRKFRRMTQEQLAERVDMTAGNLSVLERGLSDYKQSTLEALAGALDCSPVDLLARDPEDPEGLWDVWERLSPKDRRRAIGLMRALVAADDDADVVAAFPSKAIASSNA